MDLNRITLWLAAASALSLLWHSVRAPRRAFDWLLVSAFVVALSVVGWFVFPRSVGYIAMTFVTLLVVLPAQLSNAAVRAAEEQRYPRARLFTQFASFLHPIENWRLTTRIYEAFSLAQSGHLGEAEALLQILSRGSSELSSIAAGQRLALMNRWRDLKAFAEREGLFALQTRPTLLLLYLRALGELGMTEELALFMQAQERALAHAEVQHQALAYLFAFAGEPTLTERALSASSARPAPDSRDYWLAVAHENAGNLDEARRAFARLRQSTDAIVRGRAERHHAKISYPTEVTPSSPAVRAMVRHFERVLAERQRFTPDDFGNGKKPLLTFALGTFALGLSCVLVYLLGSWGDFYETHDEFIDRWAFAARQIFGGEWWRALSYLFVHQNWLHLLTNTLGLAMLGPLVERAFGRLRFTLIYFVAGTTGTALYLVLARFSLNDQKLVGASGCIMGLLGAHAAVMLRVWLRHRLTLARAIFFRLLAMIALQIAFDYTTPQIAALAHGAGLVGGFLCALCLRDEISVRAAQQSSSSLARE